MSYPLVAGIYEIDGRQYRKTPYQSLVPETNSASSKKPNREKFRDVPDVYEDEPACTISSESQKPPEISQIDPRILIHSNGKKWTAEINVPASLMGKFFGQNRRSLKILEDETGCKIKTPRKEKHAPCEITSIQSLENVQRCLDRIEIFLVDAKRTMRITHFIAFPCDHPEIQENFGFFRDAILSGDHFDASCKKEKLFTSPARLHLTLETVVIFDEVEDLEKIENVFEDLKMEISKILNSKPLILDIQGIDIMNDDPSNVNVLYAKIKGENVQKIANLTRDTFIQAGFTKSTSESEEDVKLHMTLMNARYVSQAENLKSRYSFDATAILEEMKEMYFGTVQVSQICLCPLNSTTSKQQFYTKLATLNF
ncbi:unnamed protein product [Caenorhabditis angaria]|uniref:K Homology domain-containing protein n=1 Tax=Caenorhabditis angaria TaxID=860376 RepID=A0A9P1IC50_9PELO|nr:unnamed protein product [Caenorhabditis angaria]